MELKVRVLTAPDEGGGGGTGSTKIPGSATVSEDNLEQSEGGGGDMKTTKIAGSATISEDSES
jgi:hypothetical protein